jgi:hypothetical protein
MIKTPRWFDKLMIGAEGDSGVLVMRVLLPDRLFRNEPEYERRAAISASKAYIFKP